MCNQNNKKRKEFIVIRLFSAVVERAERVVLKNKQYINQIISNSCRHRFLFSSSSYYYSSVTIKIRENMKLFVHLYEKKKWNETKWYPRNITKKREKEREKSNWWIQKQHTTSSGLRQLKTMRFWCYCSFLIIALLENRKIIVFVENQEDHVLVV